MTWCRLVSDTLSSSHSIHQEMLDDCSFVGIICTIFVLVGCCIHCRRPSCCCCCCCCSCFYKHSRMFVCCVVLCFVVKTMPCWGEDTAVAIRFLCCRDLPCPTTHVYDTTVTVVHSFGDDQSLVLCQWVCVYGCVSMAPTTLCRRSSESSLA